MVCHECPETERAARGCSKPIADPALAKARDAAKRTCAVDLEVEPWYWDAVEDASLLSSGLLGLDDLDLDEYILAQEVATERAKAREWRAKVAAQRKRR